ncbi:hypothetical protein ARMSODRAFT_1018137 [Armillaria solidipes]|uniref:DUF6535 domain-containing protein n=1 Tax=Armillaria solidipes TaxID=1076256 RepID=A0A2H3C3Y5_9AGAR|nr:hypothetical protein ARMSODRAFT_1018137 [Armillaria solidipes]
MQSARRNFGMMRRQLRKEAIRTNIKNDPEDASYEETMPIARVWGAYEHERRIHDANMVDESQENVDVLLVFAGLFLVVTATICRTETCRRTTPLLASLLFELVLVQRTIANDASVDTIPSSPLSSNIAFVPATTDVWVNGLWFTSLFLSLTTTLVTVVTK